MVKLKDLIPISKDKMPENLVQVPTFISGILEQTFTPEYEKARKGNDNFAFCGNDKDGTKRGSNPFILGLVNKILAPNFRVITPTDDIYETIFPMIKGRFYADLNALDVWQTKPNYERNNGIWKQANELAEETQGKVNYPFRIQGFYFVPDSSEKGYGARIVPASNFRIIEDEKLSLPTDTKFNSLDENGMVIPDENGKYTKSTLGNGVSRVFLGSFGFLNSNSDYLAGSVDGGRVVVTSTEGACKKFSLKN